MFIQTYGHNSGPDALARKQCRARVLAPLGRALVVPPGITLTDVETAESYQILARSADRDTRGIGERSCRLFCFLKKGPSSRILELVFLS